MITSEKTIRVFLADDHVMVREGLAALVSRDDRFEVVGQTGDGMAALEQIGQLKPDVAILDITMPGLNGLDVCRELAKRASGTAILMLTIHDDDQFIARALEYGASGYLLKEAAVDQLINALQTVANGQVYLGQGISRAVLQRIARGGEDPYDRLTSRERQVLQLIVEGKTSRQVADNLGLAVKTVETHRCHLMQKLNIHDQTCLVKYALRRGIVSLE
ncbi:MAG: response regulator transcription factor [Phycisphaerae bacterium]|jgi:two-component system response regulator NreC